MRLRHLETGLALVLLVALIGDAAAQPATFAECWGRATSGEASRRCIRDGGAAIRGGPDYPCFQAIAYARSAWRQAAEDSFANCEGEYASQHNSVPGVLDEQYRSALAALSPRVTPFIELPPGSSGGSAGMVLFPSVHGHVRGRCGSDAATCELAALALDAYLAGDTVDAPSTTVVAALHAMEFSCDSGRLCELTRAARDALATGSPELAAPTELETEREALDAWRCEDPAACAAAESARSDEVGPSTDLEVFRRSLDDGSLACVGEACPDLSHARDRASLERTLREWRER